MNKLKHLGPLLIVFVMMAAATGYSRDASDGRTDLKRAVVKIDSLTCGACFNTINKGLSSLDGFSGMGANLLRKLIAVDFKAPLTEAGITEKLTEVGYPGTVQSIEPVSEKESFAYIDARRPSACGGREGSCCVLPKAPESGQDL